MRTYIIRRLLLLIPTLFLATLIVFLMVRLIPGSIVDVMVGEMRHAAITDKAALLAELGLDVPILTQYGRWIGFLPQVDGSFSGIFQGDLGNSLWRGTPVIQDIGNRWPVTLELSLMALIVAQLIGLPIAIFSALRQDTWGDYIGRSFAILCLAVPSFWLATMIIVFPSMWWGYMAPLAIIGFTENPIANLKQFIVPSIVLGMAMAGISMRMMRTMMLEVLRQDYIRTAWAKGLRERTIVVRHALKNALIPVVTLLGMMMPSVIAGSVIIEEIFTLPGMGRLIVESTTRRDYTIVSGVMLLYAAGIMLINLIVDLTYSYLDPRVHYK